MVIDKHTLRLRLKRSTADRAISVPVCVMTAVLLKKTKNNGYAGFTCTGHAGYADSGYDIVCSAVSVLVINTINAMECFADEKMEVITGEEDGVIDVTFIDPVNEKTKLLMDTMVLGLESIEQQYGKKYLKLKFEEV